MMPDVIAIGVRIEGRVQGVWYRNWTVTQAGRLNLSGWVRNRRDGSVEALFCGPESAVREMTALCWQGPPAARVTDVAETSAEAPAGPGFLQLPTA